MQYRHLAEHYDNFLQKEAVNTWRAGILKEIKILGVRSGKVLDLGAGTGIGAKLIREIGNYHLTLLDKSREMLVRAEPYADRIVVCDIADFSFPKEKFDLMVSGFEAINYLSSSELQRMFCSVSNHLNPNGYFIFDYASPCYMRENREIQKTEYRSNDTRLLLSHGLDHRTNGTATRLSFFRAGKTLPEWRELHIQYSFGVQTIKKYCNNTLELLNVRNLQDSVFNKNAKAHVYSFKSPRSFA